MLQCILEERCFSVSIARASLQASRHCFLCNINSYLPPLHWHWCKGGYADAEISPSNCLADVSQHTALFLAQKVAELVTVLSCFLFVFAIIKVKLSSRLINRRIWELFYLYREPALVVLKDIFMCLVDKLPDCFNSFLEGWKGSQFYRSAKYKVIVALNFSWVA